ncbi:amidohydrolase family protein [Granulicella aggregans]|jgi:predicted TIM-barrel fold metal-dependent hydrolase|uniref:amidohydrolase family protein n=1 Tax=Granulicella aggregans TaxID=474949 RepID=UPI0021DFD6DD|nr:amidohydrolase family protein [Granulicella aggregans]
MKLIAIEEHFLTAEIRAAWATSAIGQEGTAGFDRGEIEERLDDLGQGRIALMDESGVEVQVLSVTTPALHNLDPEESLILARCTNDLVAATIAKYPKRFQGFATLPTASPADAAIELERGVQRLGLVGTMLCGRTRDKNLDHPDFLPLFSTAAKLGVPVFVHPQIPQRAVRDTYYSGFGELIDTAFATFALGWHYEAGIQFVRLMLAGVFDQYPDLQIILGHWGEVVLFYLERLNSLARVAKLQRPVADYMRNNLYVTPSGMWNQSYLHRTLEIVGPERILFSTDYPYQYRPGGAGASFLNEAVLSREEKELFAHGNWERLTKAVDLGRAASS